MNYILYNTLLYKNKFLNIHDRKFGYVSINPVVLFSVSDCTNVIIVLFKIDRSFQYKSKRREKSYFCVYYRLY